MLKSRWHLLAWGSRTLPDLNLETDDQDEIERVRRHYRFVSVALLTPISRETIARYLTRNTE